MRTIKELMMRDLVVATGSTSFKDAVRPAPQVKHS